MIQRSLVEVSVEGGKNIIAKKEHKRTKFPARPTREPLSQSLKQETPKRFIHFVVSFK
jgi:hypothetical protein